MQIRRTRQKRLSLLAHNMTRCQVSLYATDLPRVGYCHEAMPNLYAIIRMNHGGAIIFIIIMVVIRREVQPSDVQILHYRLEIQIGFKLCMWMYHQDHPYNYQYLFMMIHRHDYGHFPNPRR
jgi:hypothetical protein